MGDPDEAKYRCRICTLVRPETMEHDSTGRCLVCVKAFVARLVALGQQVPIEQARIIAASNMEGI